MALQGALTLDNGIALSAAYLVVLSINSGFITNDSSVTVNIAIFKDATAYNAGKPEVEQYSHRCSDGDFTTYFSEAVLDDLGKTTLTQAYLWLRSFSPYTAMTEV